MAEYKYIIGMAIHFLFMFISWQVIDSKAPVLEDSSLSRFDGYKLWGLGLLSGLGMTLPLIIFQ